MNEVGMSRIAKMASNLVSEVDLSPAHRNLLEIIEVLFNYVNYGSLAGHDVNMHPETETTEAMKDKHMGILIILPSDSFHPRVFCSYLTNQTSKVRQFGKAPGSEPLLVSFCRDDFGMKTMCPQTGFARCFSFSNGLLNINASCCFEWFI